MAWVRIHDGAMTHPKVVGLSDKAFRLWIWGLSYSQQHLTDGAIVTAAVPARLARAAADLIAVKLWDRRDGDFQIHDYLDWNDSRETVVKKRTEAKARMSSARQRSSREHIERTSPEVLRRVGLDGNGHLPEKGSGEKPSDDVLGPRAGRLLQVLYPQWYTQFRNGARLRLIGNSLEFQDALSLVKHWTDEEIEKLAHIFLTTDEPWISETDRGFRVFALKASWCHDRLAQWEAQQAKKRPA